jgi:hypothetical protein
MRVYKLSPALTILLAKAVIAAIVEIAERYGIANANSVALQLQYAPSHRSSSRHQPATPTILQHG